MKSPVHIRTYYEERTPVGVRFSGVSRTKQEFAEESDINVLVRRFMKTGQIPPTNDGRARFADVSELGDFTESVRRIERVMDEFEELPARVRDRFDNDPAQLVGFLQDPANLEEAITLGLVEKTAQAVAQTPSEPTPKVEIEPKGED